MSQTTQPTQVLFELSQGYREAADRLLPLVYDELRILAASYMRQERPDHTLQPTALVHEAYLRMIDQSQVDWKNRAHFFAVAAQMIRRILVDHARRKGAAKRGGARKALELDSSLVGAEDGQIDLLALDEALDALQEFNDRHRTVVELRFFGGLTLAEIGHVLGILPETARSDWRTARAWLRARLEGGL